MKIASITIYCNERFRLEAWKSYYDEYKDELYRHIIVNNGDSAETPVLRSTFPDSIVLESPTPNMMASYNLALRHILDSYPEVDAIAQIVNDIRLSKGCFSILYEYLFSNPALAMVSPVLLQKDSDIIDCYGCTINVRNLDFIHNDAGRHLGEIHEETRLVSGLPAGIFLARRSCYERFGFQDERLEMYSDEVDMGLRVSRLGLLLGATSRVQAWHQHVNPAGKKQRSPRAGYLMGRNPVYIARKFYPGRAVFRVFFRRFYRGLDEIRSAVMHGKTWDHYRFGWASVRGAFSGLLGKR